MTRVLQAFAVVVGAVLCVPSSVAAQPKRPVPVPTGRPVVRPSQPRVVPARPGAQPVRRGAQPVRRGVQPVRPGAQPVRPGVQPVRPGTQPVVRPGAQPAGAAAAKTLAETLEAPSALDLEVPRNDDGRHVELSWEASGARNVDGTTVSYLVFRTRVVGYTSPPSVPAKLAVGDELGDWTLIAVVEGTRFTDDVTDGHDKGAAVVERVWKLDSAQPAPALDAADKKKGPAAASVASGAAWVAYAVRAARLDAQGNYNQVSPAILAGPIEAETSFFNTDRRGYLLIILLMALALGVYASRIKKDPEGVFIRRIPGVDAIEEAVGRSTEMGRPVLYVTGVEEIQNIQTIASLLVLGHVAEMTAEYDTEMKVANFFPLTMVVAEEIVRQGFANAGRIDAHKPENVMFISAEQFAFAAGVNGLILRDKPATNIYLGRFFAESLILAETGYVTKAVQIAGTAEITQLPFFIAACDYTIIGEELYAVSAYLSREPGLLATLKANDALKIFIMTVLLVGVAGSTFHFLDLAKVLFP